VHKALLAIADQYYDAAARFEPIGATENGDNRFDDQLGMSIAPAKRAAQFKLYRQLERFPEHLLPINQMDSLPVTLANYAGGEGAQPLAPSRNTGLPEPPGAAGRHGSTRRSPTCAKG
jgi:hypothetical protein